MSNLLGGSFIMSAQRCMSQITCFFVHRGENWLKQLLLGAESDTGPHFSVELWREFHLACEIRDSALQGERCSQNLYLERTIYIIILQKPQKGQGLHNLESCSVYSQLIHHNSTGHTLADEARDIRKIKTLDLWAHNQEEACLKFKGHFGTTLHTVNSQPMLSIWLLYFTNLLLFKKFY